MSDQVCLDFDGAAFDRERDGDRLGAQLAAVKTAMSDGRWRTLSALSRQTGAPDASVSARLRDLRKDKFGGYLVQRRYIADGLWEYRLAP